MYLFHAEHNNSTHKSNCIWQEHYQLIDVKYAWQLNMIDMCCGKRNYVMQLYNYWLAVIHVYFNVNVFKRFESLEDKTLSVSLGCVIIKLV